VEFTTLVGNVFDFSCHKATNTLSNRFVRVEMIVAEGLDYTATKLAGKLEWVARSGQRCKSLMF
jgi:hypothetical protein